MADEEGGGHLVRYEPQEKAPHVLAAAMAAQTVVLILAGIMLTPLVIARGAGLNEADTSWLVFAALVAAGVSTWLQLIRKGPIGSGYTLFVGSNVAFVAVAVTALQHGGLAAARGAGRARRAQHLRLHPLAAAASPRAHAGRGRHRADADGDERRARDLEDAAAGRPPAPSSPAGMAWCSW